MKLLFVILVCVTTVQAFTFNFEFATTDDMNKGPDSAYDLVYGHMQRLDTTMTAFSYWCQGDDGRRVFVATDSYDRDAPHNEHSFSVEDGKASIVFVKRNTDATPDLSGENLECRIFTWMLLDAEGGLIRGLVYPSYPQITLSSRVSFYERGLGMDNFHSPVSYSKAMDAVISGERYSEEYRMTARTIAQCDSFSRAELDAPSHQNHIDSKDEYALHVCRKLFHDTRAPSLLDLYFRSAMLCAFIGAILLFFFRKQKRE